MKKRMLGMMLLAACLFAQIAGADDDFSWYVGFSGGRSDFSVDSERIAFQMRQDGNSVTAANITVDDSDRAYKVFVGTEFTPYLGAELGYTDLGEPQIEISGTGISTQSFLASAARRQPAGSSGVYGNLLGRYAILDNFLVYGRLGLINWRSHVNISTSGFAVNDKRGGIDAHWGVGVRYQISKQFSSSLEWERFDIDSPAEVISLNLRFHFY